jgi:hypothetical protein
MTGEHHQFLDGKMHDVRIVSAAGQDENPDRVIFADLFDEDVHFFQHVRDNEIDWWMVDLHPHCPVFTPGFQVFELHKVSFQRF